MTQAELAGRVLDRARALVRRDDTMLTEERVEQYLRSGEWSLDTYWDLLERHAAAAPEASAIVDENGTITTWEQLRARSLAFAAALLDLGYRSGDCLGVQLPNWSEFCIAVLGAVRAGVCPVFIHPPYRAYEMDYILRLTEARGIVVPSRYRGVGLRGARAPGAGVAATPPGRRFAVRAAGERSFEALVASHRGRVGGGARPRSRPICSC